MSDFSFPVSDCNYTAVKIPLLFSSVKVISSLSVGAAYKYSQLFPNIRQGIGLVLGQPFIGVTETLL